MFSSPKKGLGAGKLRSYQELVDELPQPFLHSLVESQLRDVEDPLVDEKRRQAEAPSPLTPLIITKKDFFNPTPRNLAVMAEQSDDEAQQRHWEQERRRTPNNLRRSERINPTNVMLDFEQFEQAEPRTPCKAKLDQSEAKHSTADNSNRKITRKTKNKGQKTESFQGKGLKSLAQAVKRVVGQLGQSTYKQIAQHIIQLLKRDHYISDSCEFRDQQNIKRRVYDSLNVFVSAGIVVKDGKFVSLKSQATISIQEQHLLFNQLKQMITLTELNLQQKEKRLYMLRNKFLANEQLVRRNKEKPMEPESRIQFPFIAIVSREAPNPNDSIVTPRRLILRFKDPGFRIAGDIDTILQLGFHQSERKSRLGSRLQYFNLSEDSPQRQQKSPSNKRSPTEQIYISNE